MAPSDTEKVLYGYYAGREADSVRSRADALATSAVVGRATAVTSGAGAPPLLRCAPTRRWRPRSARLAVCVRLGFHLFRWLCLFR